MQMRTRFELNQAVIWKGKHGIYKGKVVGLHDDFVFIREIIITPSGMKLLSGMVYRVEFEDVIARV
ncbi:hypothetical protein LCGC14_0915380 [marine sediment metagenome]|uniref:KOW domain-containing protein n=1 Tax=marine sediment metagenome TaxID=412755 RepID=A0A0F9NX60_9ZZZZ